MQVLSRMTIPLRLRTATRFVVAIAVCLCLAAAGRAQSYRDSIMLYRDGYIKELLAEKRQPVKPEDARYLSFFEPDPAYRVWASYIETPGATPIMIPTHSGKDKPFRECGYVTFDLNGQSLKLHLYQMIDIMTGAVHGDDLFLPFNDLTNYDLTYGGGRYLDLSKKDIVNGGVIVDFNKCYNPYCAYGEGFSCPIPPAENRMSIEINAGEKMFTKYARH